MRPGPRLRRLHHRALRRRALGGLIAFALAPAVGAAHTRSTAYSDWTPTRAELQVSRLDWTALPGLAPADLPRVVRRDGCEAGPVDEGPAREGWRRFAWPLRCEDPGPVRVDLLFGVVPGHVHLARVDGAERALTEAARATGSHSGFVGLGASHVLGGADHLVFLLMLLLGCAAAREAAWAVTGFTVGHSATLALAVSGRYAADPTTVEALIGLSILLVAAENIFRLRPARWVPVVVVGLAAAGALVSTPLAWLGVALFAAARFGWLARGRAPMHALLAGLFGLLHGLGFAGGLVALLPPGATWRPLLGFNVGVELGQLAVVVVAWPALAWLRPRGVVAWGSALGAAAGTFWMVSRLGV